MADPARILLVGHCRPDACALRSALSSLAPGARVEFVNDAATLAREATAADLLLINRVLDGEFDSDGGIELLRALDAAGDGPVLMLVSDRPEAQAEAQDAGAAPGFGKREMWAEETRRRIAGALAGKNRGAAGR